MTLDLSITDPWMVGAVTWPLLLGIVHLGYMLHKLELTAWLAVTEMAWLLGLGGLGAMHYLVFGEFAITYHSLTGTVVREDVDVGSLQLARLMGATVWAVQEPPYYWAHLTNAGLLVWGYCAALEKAERSKERPGPPSSEGSGRQSPST